MSRSLDNENPTIFAATAPNISQRRPKSTKALLWNEEVEEYNGEGSGTSEEDEREDIDAEEIFGACDRVHCAQAHLTSNVDLLRSITDPEHPVSLEQLRVVNPEDISVAGNRVLVYLTPTIPHCSMSTLIGTSTLDAPKLIARYRSFSSSSAASRTSTTVQSRYPYQSWIASIGTCCE
jgi:metal-sulfur cluster biosynthetic enzyme